MFSSIVVLSLLSTNPFVSCNHPLVDKVMYEQNAGFLCGDDQKGTISATASTPVQTLNSNFTLSSTDPVWYSASISISCSMSLTSGQSSTVELRSDTAGTPTTVRATVANSNSGTLTIGLALTNAQTVQLSYIVPPTHNVRLVSSGTCTVTLISQSAVALPTI